MKRSCCAYTLPLFEHAKFLHPVGISTCKYGVTIPLEAQTAALSAIAKGDKVQVSILCGGMEPVSAEIRRLNNKPGHLQFRYEKKAQERLRQYLWSVFGSGDSGSLLEVEEVAPFTFLFKPILKSSAPCLQISDMLLHRLDQRESDRICELVQIKHSLTTIAYDAEPVGL